MMKIPWKVKLDIVKSIYYNYIPSKTAERMFNEYLEELKKNIVLNRIRHPHDWYDWNDELETCSICGMVREIKTKKYCKYIRIKCKE